MPSASLPKFKDVMLGVSCKTGAAPLPLSAIVVGEVGALLTSVRLLEELALDVGVKLSVNIADVPGASDIGNASPLSPNPAPGPAACVMLRLAFPGLLTITVCEFVWATVTVAKFTLPGTTEIWGCTPMPASETVDGEFAASLTSEMLPLALPARVARKLAVKVLDWPGPSVIGRASPLIEKALPLIVA